MIDTLIEDISPFNVVNYGGYKVPVRTNFDMLIFGMFGGEIVYLLTSPNRFLIRAQENRFFRPSDFLNFYGRH